jgi:dimethylhistidine N-methyltransferase
VDVIGKNSFNLIEFGAGDGKKTKVLIDYFLENDLDVTYIPIDICEEAIINLINKFTDSGTDIRIDGLVAEYFTGIEWLAKTYDKPNLALFLGSNIGNFEQYEAKAFLSNLHESLNHGDFVLIGFDLKKAVDVLNLAYNDPLAITAEFNLNLLRRINHELGGNFDTNMFEYRGNYNEDTGAIESYLISQCSQNVFIDSLNRSFEFQKDETIHTENSFKYSELEIEHLAQDTGFELLRNFSDSKGYFIDSLWQVIK